jgi:hypothetical protein
VFNEDTFTRAGMKVTTKTGTLQQILARNGRCLRRLHPVHLRAGVPAVVPALVMNRVIGRS